MFLNTSKEDKEMRSVDKSMSGQYDVPGQLRNNQLKEQMKTIVRVKKKERKKKKRKKTREG